MRVNFDEFKIIVEGELTEEHPRHFTRMHVVYELRESIFLSIKFRKQLNFLNKNIVE